MMYRVELKSPIPLKEALAKFFYNFNREIIQTIELRLPEIQETWRPPT